MRKRRNTFLLPIAEDTDVETLIPSKSQRFWKLFDHAAIRKRTLLEALPDVANDGAGKRFADRKKMANFVAVSGSPPHNCSHPARMQKLPLIANPIPQNIPRGVQAPGVRTIVKRTYVFM